MPSILIWILLGFGLAGVQDTAGDEPFWKWSLAKAVKILNSSAWARQETFTSVIPGVGSGQAGEKEIYSTFYVRFLSAEPIREAYARVLQIEHGYDRLTGEKKRRFDQLLEPLLGLDTDEWVVIALGFRSNDPEQESQIRRYFQSQTTATLRDKVFLSTDQYSQVRIHAYFPPVEESVGAKFVFPRTIGGADLVSAGKGRISFELLDLPVRSAGGGQRGRRGGDSAEADGSTAGGTMLRATFSLEDMIRNGKLIL